MKKLTLSLIILSLTIILVASDVNYSFNYIMLGADKAGVTYEFDFTDKKLSNFSRSAINSFAVPPVNSLVFDHLDGENYKGTYAYFNEIFQNIEKESYTFIMVLGPWDDRFGQDELICNSKDVIFFDYLINMFEFLPSQNSLLALVYPKSKAPNIKEFASLKQISEPGKHLIFIEAERDDAQDAIRKLESIFRALSRSKQNTSAFTYSMAFMRQADREQLKYYNYQLSRSVRDGFVVDYNLSN